MSPNGSEHGNDRSATAVCRCEAIAECSDVDGKHDSKRFDGKHDDAEHRVVLGCVSDYFLELVCTTSYSRSALCTLIAIVQDTFVVSW